MTSRGRAKSHWLRPGLEPSFSSLCSYVKREFACNHPYTPSRRVSRALRERALTMVRVRTPEASESDRFFGADQFSVVSRGSAPLSEQQSGCTRSSASAPGSEFRSLGRSVCVELGRRRQREEDERRRERIGEEGRASGESEAGRGIIRSPAVLLRPSA
eukprot:3940895-Rhodomonas_salina.8